MAFDDFQNKSEEHYYEGEPRTYNRMWMGLTVALLLPLFCFIGLLHVTNSIQFTSVEYVVRFLTTSESAYLTNIFILAFMPNLLGFFWAYKTERWKFSRGYVMGSLFAFVFFFLRTAL